MKKRILSMLLAAGMMVMMLAGCGSSDSKSSDAQGTQRKLKKVEIQKRKTGN